MRIWLAIALCCACGHRSQREPRTIANLGSHDTPISLDHHAGTLFVGLGHGDLSTKIVTIDVKSGTVHDHGSALPAGKLAFRDGKIYMGEYIGAIGTVSIDPADYRRIVKLDRAISTIAATPRGFAVGAAGHVLHVDPSGQVAEVQGAAVGDAYTSVDQVIATAAGEFATGATADVVVRIDGERAAVLADHQQYPKLLAATADTVVWTTGDPPNQVELRLVGVAPSGGTPKLLAQAAPGARIQAVAADDKTIACSMFAPKKVGESGIYVIEHGGQPRHVADARAILLVLANRTLYWIDDSDDGWLVRSLEL